MPHLTPSAAAVPTVALVSSAEQLYDRLQFVLDAVLPPQLDRDLTREELVQLDRWFTQIIAESWSDYFARTKGEA